MKATFKRGDIVSDLDGNIGRVDTGIEFIAGNYMLVNVTFDGNSRSIPVMELEKVNERKKSKKTKTQSKRVKRGPA
jgi:hypothetical protein